MVSLVFSGQQLTGEELAVYRAVESRLVFVTQAGHTNGAGSLIDDAGYFIIHRSAVYAPVVTGRLASGQTITLKLVTTDEPTQLALLEAPGYIVPGGNSLKRSGSVPVRASVQKPETFALAVLPSGQPMRAELVSASKIGIVNPARRVMNLAEYRFEAPPQTVGGSLLFNLEGRLVGILGATLDGPPLTVPQNQAFRGGAGLAQNQKAVGPAQLTVGYSVSADVLDRVIEGFRSPTRTVEHPALGIFCRDAGGEKGALVDSVLAGSPAEKAGMKAGDVITELDGKPVTNQIDYARSMLKQRVGAVIRVKVARGSTEQTLLVTVGR